jgi:hypothetical protein
MAVKNSSKIRVFILNQPLNLHIPCTGNRVSLQFLPLVSDPGLIGSGDGGG